MGPEAPEESPEEDLQKPSADPGTESEPPIEPKAPRWRRIWSKLHSRFARQMALVAVAIGTIAAVGHFIGGMIGWWHAYELTFRHETPPPSAKSPLTPIEPLSIVVLPLAIEGDATDIEWFGDALLGDLVSEVARLQGSFVIARETANTYKGRIVDPREVARELNVRYVVRGSLRRDGTAIRLKLALIDGESGRQRWDETFAVERAELGKAFDEFVRRLSRDLTLEVQRSAGDRLAALSPSQVSADDLAMRAYALWYRSATRENLIEALGLVEQAAEKDPNSVRAWGGLVFLNLNGVLNGWLPNRAAAVRRIDEAAAQLDRLDPDGFFGHQAKVAQAYLKRDFPAMLRLTEAWANSHQHAVAVGAYGTALLFNGRPEEGIPHIQRAMRLSPRDPFRAEWQYRLALAHYMVGRYDQARDWAQTAQASNPRLPWPPVQAAALLKLGQQAEAKRALDEFLVRHPTYNVDRIIQRLPGTSEFVEGRDRLVTDLRELGLR